MENVETTACDDSLDRMVTRWVDSCGSTIERIVASSTPEEHQKIQVLEDFVFLVQNSNKEEWSDCQFFLTGCTRSCSSRHLNVVLHHKIDVVSVGYF
jgi:hypothetical protein